MVLARSLSGTITISIEALVDLPLKFCVGMNLVRHGNFFSEGSSRKTSFLHLKAIVDSHAAGIARMQEFDCYSGGTRTPRSG
jgi:hypothetical protein